MSWGGFPWGAAAWGGGAPISGAASTSATPTPATVAGTGTVQAPVVALVAKPAQVAGTGTVQAPAVSTEYGPTPATVAGTGTVQAPLVALVALPSTVLGTGSVQTPSVSTPATPLPTPRGFLFQAWSMAAQEPVLVRQLNVLPHSGTTAALSDALGVELTSMGDRTGWYLAYDRGQAGSGKPTTLYAQLVHFDGAEITTGPEFTWDAAAHGLWRVASVYQNFSHQIVGLSATKAIRFWFYFDGSLTIRAERIEFLYGIDAAPVVTDLGAITGEPAGGTSAASFWAQRTRDGAAAVYWTEVLGGSVVVHVDGFFDSPPQWTRLTPDPIINTGVAAGVAPYHYGSVLSGDEAYFSGFQTSPYGAATSLDLIVSSPGRGVHESSRRSKPSDYTDPKEALTGLSDGSAVHPQAASLTVASVSSEQILTLDLWSHFVIEASAELNVSESSPYPGTLVSGSVNSYTTKKQASKSNAMFFGRWSDSVGHSVVDYINHARFPAPPRGALNVVGHRQSMRSKAGVR